MTWREQLRRWLLDPILEIVVRHIDLARDEIKRFVGDELVEVIRRQQDQRTDTRRDVEKLVGLINEAHLKLDAYAPFTPTAAKQWECVRYACEKYRKDPNTNSTAAAAVKEWAQLYAQEHGWSLDPDSCLVMMSVNILIYGPLK